MARPRPVPLPTSLVVKNGSKMRCSDSLGMPTPLSSTSSTANGRTATSFEAWESTPRRAVIVIGRRALLARERVARVQHEIDDDLLDLRLVRLHVGEPLLRGERISIVAGTVERKHAVRFPRSACSNRRGAGWSDCGREKASNWPVSSAARFALRSICRSFWCEGSSGCDCRFNNSV